MKIVNDKDARKIAKEYLSKNYGTHEIDATLHVVGSNNWEVRAHSEELEITLFLDKETGDLLLNPITKRVVKRDIIEPPISIKDKISRILRKESFRVNWGWLFATVGLTVSGSVISAFFEPPHLGITISLIFGALSIIYGKYMFTHTIIIDRG